MSPSRSAVEEKKRREGRSKSVKSLVGFGGDRKRLTVGQEFESVLLVVHEVERVVPEARETSGFEAGENETRRSKVSSTFVLFRDRDRSTHKYPPTLIQNPLMNAAIANAAMNTGKSDATRMT